MNVKTTVKNVDVRRLTNNTQKVALKLLRANGSWVSRTELEKAVQSATARVRDLRKPQFGQFEVECESASNLNRNGNRYTFFYRINPRSVSTRQVQTVFGV